MGELRFCSCEILSRLGAEADLFLWMGCVRRCSVGVWILFNFVWFV